MKTLRHNGTAFFSLYVARETDTIIGIVPEVVVQTINSKKY